MSTSSSADCGHRDRVDRYLLRELSEPEAAAFEEHYFDCPACADEVRLANALAEAARTALATGPRTAEVPAIGTALAAEPLPPIPRAAPAPGPTAGRSLSPRTWVVRIAAGAALPLAVAAGVQTLVVVPRLRQEIALRDQPRVLDPKVLRPLTRGESPRIVAGPGQPFVTLQLPIPRPAAASYRARLLDSRGTAIASFGVLAVPAPMPGEPIQLSLPIEQLPSGSYALEITRVGGKDTPPERYGFSLER